LFIIVAVRTLQQNQQSVTQDSTGTIERKASLFHDLLSWSYLQHCV